ncbi:DNA recombination protein RmuC [Gordonia desulfuricans]|uniref:DNA recombination protein RmuC n=1 Tax=Gordonia desulfuricans TaxID=89051 RepID=A0A7K3LI87_9ACTN|nr:DNA recombination protein RmuC [Gordonia desulfuricans]NDK87976.1 DNA recombination protein RmuC [Gordonia desulfuricans]
MTLALIAFVVGILAGVAIGWFAATGRAASAVATARAETEAVRESQELVGRSLSAASEDAARRQSTAIGAQMTHIVDPLRALVGQLAEELRRVEQNRVGAYAGLTEQVRGVHAASTRLGDQTRALTNALHTPHLRGRWGEMQLERVVELAGMTRHCDFDTQVTIGTDEAKRPDMIVRLAGGRSIVVDAKVPLHSYLDAAECDDPALREELLASHAQAVRAHIKTLSSKAYWAALPNSPEMVVLFVPGDAVLEWAVRSDPGLIDFGFAKNVVLTTPSSLVALLRTVALGWRHDAMARDAAVIHELGVELHHRLETVLGHVDRVGVSLRRAVEAYNSTVGALDSRVGVTARKLASLEALGNLDEPTSPRVIHDTIRDAGGVHADT